ncbi:hypothetical protein AABM38_04250 [Heyndrickxia sp. MSNUG]|uniref:hypothetical protein n=1 Tax=Heyndrickxia sp. MSNUG TaxID=3136677 RepID=UPI003C2EEBC9
MKFSWLVKNKLILFILIIQLAALSFFPFIQKAGASTYDAGGFIIQADRVVGENMKAMIIMGEKAGSEAEPMLRITYDSVQIYGMKLTKQLQTAGGTVSITMKASGPVHINGMQVDTSAISFKGACVHAAKLMPSAALEDVTMVAHSMNADSSSLDQLQLQTINGDGGVQKPGNLKILQDLSSMPFEQMKKEIGKITSGQLPLTCDGDLLKDGKVADGIGGITDPVLDGVTDPISEVTDPLEDTVGKITDPLKDTVGKITDPLKDTVGKVTDPLKDTVGKVTTPVKDTVGKVVDGVVSPVIGEADKVTAPVKETVKTTAETAKAVTQPAVEPVKKTVDQTAKTACEKLSEANGQLTKELSLELIDQALKENKALKELCPEDAALTKQLENWTEGMLESLGLLSLLGVKPSEEDQLKKMREAILKEPDGTVISFD